MLERPSSKNSPDVQWLRCINYYCQTSHTLQQESLFVSGGNYFHFLSLTFSLVPLNDMTFHQRHLFSFSGYIVNIVSK